LKTGTGFGVVLLSFDKRKRALSCSYATRADSFNFNIPPKAFLGFRPRGRFSKGADDPLVHWNGEKPEPPTL
jgi:hypothetical protein